MKKLLFIFLLFTGFTVVAQKKDFLVTSSGDSLYGQIRLQGKSFSIHTSNGETIIAAGNVRKVHASNFKGTTVVRCRLHLYSDNIAEMQLGYTPIRETDTVMVLKEIYSTEKMNLYFGTDNLKTHYYFYKTPQNEVPLQLVVRYHLDGGFSSYSSNTAAYRGEKSRMHIEEDKGYINQLRFLMKDCDAIEEAVWDVLQYRSYSLKNLIKKYNECD
jgi:hypothetical protein